MNKKVNTQALFEHIENRLWKFDARPLGYAWNTEENCLFFGPGGYGKTEAAGLFCNYLRKEGIIDPNAREFVLNFNQAMTDERLLGGIDIKKFNEEGRLIYLLQYAFTAHEVVIFEELWDSFAGVLLTLKDILTSKMVRNGSQQEPIKTKIIIANSNKSRDEVIEDNSTEALFQRFVFESLVTWDTHLASDYLEAFKRNNQVTTVDKQMEWVSVICASASADGKVISPRTAFKALKSTRINGIQSLKYMFGLAKYVAELEKEIRKHEEEQKKNAINLQRVKDQIMQADKTLDRLEARFTTLVGKDSSPVTELLFLAKELSSISLPEFPIDDDHDLMTLQVRMESEIPKFLTQIGETILRKADQFSVVAMPGSALQDLRDGKSITDALKKVTLPTFGTSNVR